jgi:uncharacterized membrane protein YgcG
MSDAAQIHPYPTREDAYFQALEAFIRTSAGYLDIDQRLPEKGVPRQWHERATPFETLS